MADPKDFDPADYVLVRKTVLDEYLRTTIELNKATLWLRSERERLLAEIDLVRNEADELNVSAQKLMRMYRELEAEVRQLQEENVRLVEATRVLGQRAPGVN